MGILARRALCTSFDRLQRPANFLDPHVLIAVGAPWISLEKRDAEEPRSSLERGDHEDECRCNQTAGAAKRRLALFAAKKAAIGSLAVGSQAVGALAVGAVALGALAIGRPILKRLIIAHCHVRLLDID